MSMSTGDIAVQAPGAHTNYALPVYEITGLKDPAATLLERSASPRRRQAGRLTQKIVPRGYWPGTMNLLGRL